MEKDLSSVDSLLHEAGLLTDARRASAAGPEMPRPLGLTSRTASITDLDAGSKAGRLLALLQTRDYGSSAVLVY